MVDFKKDKFIEEAINNLYEKVKLSEYGKKYSWEQLQQMAVGNSKISKNKLYYIVNKVGILMMVNDSRVFITEHAFGKRVINPSEHSVVAKKQVRKSVRVYKKAGYILAATDLDLLSEEQKNEVIEDANKYRTLEMFAAEMIKKKQLPNVVKSGLPDANLILDVINLFSKKKIL